MKTLYESLLDDLDDLLDKSDSNVELHHKVGKYYNLAGTRDKTAMLTIFGDSKRMLNMFNSKKLNSFNKTLHKFDLKSNYGFNSSSNRKVIDNKIIPLYNVLLNMDVDWVENEDVDSMKKYFSNIVKDGWEKYLLINKYNQYGCDLALSIHCGLAPGCSIEISFVKK
jgi:hypothetical protein